MYSALGLSLADSGGRALKAMLANSATRLLTRTSDALP